MRAVWDKTKASAAEVQMDLVRRGNQIAYTTVKTMLDRLVKAGICNSEEVKGRYFYSARVTQDRVAKEWYKHLQKMIFAGKGKGSVFESTLKRIATASKS